MSAEISAFTDFIRSFQLVEKLADPSLDIDRYCFQRSIGPAVDLLMQSADLLPGMTLSYFEMAGEFQDLVLGAYFSLTAAEVPGVGNEAINRRQNALRHWERVLEIGDQVSLAFAEAGETL